MNAFMTVGCTIVAIALSSLAHARTQQTPWTTALTLNNKGAIVFIDAKFTEPQQGAADRHEYGIGFVITDAGYILTAAHVISTLPDQPGEKLDSVTGYLRTPKGTPETLNVVIKRASEDEDVALLLMPDIQDSFQHVEIEDNFQGVFPGALVAALSIPPGEPSVRALEGSISSIDSSMGGDIDTSIPFVSGESGCPIFNHNDKVVGLCEAGSDSNPSVTQMTPIMMAAHLIDVARKLTQASHGPADTTTSPVVVYTTSNSGASRQVSRRYCTQADDKLVVDDVTPLHGRGSANIESVSVDPQHPNCIDVIVTLAAASTGSTSAAPPSNPGDVQDQTGSSSASSVSRAAHTHAAWVGLKIDATRIVTDGGGNEIHMPAQRLNLQVSGGGGI